MQMLQSDWLNDRTLTAISVQWLEVVYEMAAVFRFSLKVLNEHFDANRYSLTHECITIQTTISDNSILTFTQ